MIKWYVSNDEKQKTCCPICKSKKVYVRNDGVYLNDNVITVEWKCKECERFFFVAYNAKCYLPNNSPSISF